MPECSRSVALVVGLLFFATSLGAGEQAKSLTPREQYEALLKDYQRAAQHGKRAARGSRWPIPDGSDTMQRGRYGRSLPVFFILPRRTPRSRRPWMPCSRL